MKWSIGMFAQEVAQTGNELQEMIEEVSTNDGCKMKDAGKNF